MEYYFKEVFEKLDSLTDEEFDGLLLKSGIENCPLEEGENMEEKQILPIGDTWEDLIKEFDKEMKWGYELETHKDAFLLGANINIGKYYKKYYGYICIYLGFWTLSFGKDYFD